MIDSSQRIEFIPEQQNDKEQQQQQQQHDHDYTSTSSIGILKEENKSPFRFRASPHTLLYPEASLSLSLDANGGDNNEANSFRNPTTIHITSAQEVQDYRWKHRDIIPLEEPVIFVITPTYNSKTKPLENNNSTTVNKKKKKNRTPQEQLVDLTTLGQTLLLDGNIYWIVVEDADSCCYNPAIRLLLHRIGLPFAHVYAPTMKPQPDNPEIKVVDHRGVDQRNRALEVVEGLLLWQSPVPTKSDNDIDKNNNSSISGNNQNNSNSSTDNNRIPSSTKAQHQQQQLEQQQQQQQPALNGIVYFGDDDNTYDVRLFPALRQVKTAGVVPVGFAGMGGYERCIVHPDTGNIMSLASGWKATRKLPIDMAGFAFSTRYLLPSSSWKNPNVVVVPANNNNTQQRGGNNDPTNNNNNNNSNPQIRFHWEWDEGMLETKFVEQLVDQPSDLNPLADNCTKLYVWHTKPRTYGTDGKVHFDDPPNPLTTTNNSNNNNNNNNNNNTDARPMKKLLVQYELDNKKNGTDAFTNGGAAASSRIARIQGTGKQPVAFAILPPMMPLRNMTNTTFPTTTNTPTDDRNKHRWDDVWKHIAPRIGGISLP